MMKNNKLGSLFWILLVVCILNIVGHLAVYPALPDTVPIHWGASGEVNGWSSKQSAASIPSTRILSGSARCGTFLSR